MEWVRENWFFIIFFILFITMHFLASDAEDMAATGDMAKKERSTKVMVRGHQRGEKKGGHGCC